MTSLSLAKVPTNASTAAGSTFLNLLSTPSVPTTQTLRPTSPHLDLILFPFAQYGQKYNKTVPLATLISHINEHDFYKQESPIRTFARAAGSIECPPCRYGESAENDGRTSPRHAVLGGYVGALFMEVPRSSAKKAYKEEANKKRV